MRWGPKRSRRRSCKGFHWCLIGSRLPPLILQFPDTSYFRLWEYYYHRFRLKALAGTPFLAPANVRSRRLFALRISWTRSDSFCISSIIRSIVSFALGSPAKCFVVTCSTSICFVISSSVLSTLCVRFLPSKTISNRNSCNKLHNLFWNSAVWKRSAPISFFWRHFRVSGHRFRRWWLSPFGAIYSTLPSLHRRSPSPAALDTLCNASRPGRSLSMFLYLDAFRLFTYQICKYIRRFVGTTRPPPRWKGGPFWLQWTRASNRIWSFGCGSVMWSWIVTCVMRGDCLNWDSAAEEIWS